MGYVIPSGMNDRSFFLALASVANKQHSQALCQDYYVHENKTTVMMMAHRMSGVSCTFN